MESSRKAAPIHGLRGSDDVDDNKEGKHLSSDSDCQCEESLRNDSNSLDMEDELGVSALSIYENIANENLQSEENFVNLLPITCLPEVALVNIMEYLSLKDRYHLSVTCKLFYSLFSHPQLWRVAYISLLTQDNYQGRKSLRWKLTAVMHQTMAEIVCRFSHLFQHLSLEMFRRVQPFDDICRRMLVNLNKDCRLESLSLRLGALASNDEYSQRASAWRCDFKDLPLIVGLIRNAVRLKRLNIISWPLHMEAEGKNDISEALLRNKKIRGLESLSIFYVEPKCESWTERNPKLPTVETTLELVSHFRNLTHLALRSPMLSNEIVVELASKKRSKLCLFQILIVYSRDSAFLEGYKVPEISSKAWKALKLSSPELKVEYLAMTRIPQEQFNLMLKPEVPLCSLTILNYGRCDPELVENIVEKYKYSLEKFVCLCDATNCDQALINLVKSCSQLQHLVFHGNIQCKTIIKMAEIIREKDLKLNCFEFKEKNIQTANFASENGIDDDVVVAKDAEGDEYYLVGLRAWYQDEDEHRRMLHDMTMQVSHALGYRWRPLA